MVMNINISKVELQIILTDSDLYHGNLEQILGQPVHI